MYVVGTDWFNYYASICTQPYASLYDHGKRNYKMGKCKVLKLVLQHTHTHTHTYAHTFTHTHAYTHTHTITEALELHTGLIVQPHNVQPHNVFCMNQCMFHNYCDV